jgi:hypothetical protein
MLPAGPDRTAGPWSREFRLKRGESARELKVRAPVEVLEGSETKRADLLRGDLAARALCSELDPTHQSLDVIR